MLRRELDPRKPRPLLYAASVAVLAFLASLPADTVKLLAQALTARPLVEQTAPTPLLSAFDGDE